MTEQDRILLDGFRMKIRQLIALCEKEKAEIRQLRNQVERLEIELNSARKETEMIEHRYNNLKLAKSLVVSDVESDEAKRKIGKIVREIDKCIAMLNQ